MRISHSLAELHSRDFLTNTRGELTLIVPARSKRTWASHERMLRSAVIDTDGRIVSLGFPKFFNWGEDADDTAALTAALNSAEPVTFAEKLDGSLCIRSVIDGDVVLRTRGTLDGGDHGAPMRSLAESDYPQLLDGSRYGGWSLLCEFTSPEFPIVLSYAEPGLTLLGAVSHEDGRLMSREALVEVGRRLDIPLTPVCVLPRDPDELVAGVAALSGSEGIVASCADGQVLVKVKSASYLRAHALRFALSPRRLAELSLEHDVRDERGLRALITELAGGHEFELEEMALRTFVRVQDARARMDADLAAIEEWVAAHSDLDRREFAAHVGAYAGKTAPLYFSLRDGQRERALAWLHRRVADEVAAG